jgi:DNA-binding FadR family transcriptional regulator
MDKDERNLTELFWERKRKIPERIAESIAKDIIENRLEPGTVLGRQDELLEKYNVSRDPLREAIRLLEWQGIAKSVRGKKGGLIVSGSAERSVVYILRDYLNLTDITFDEVMEVRRVLEALAVKRASERLDEQGIAELKELLNERWVKHSSRGEDIKHLFIVFKKINEIAKNPALALLLEPLNFLSIDFVDIESASDEQFVAGGKKAWRLVRKIVEAIIANDIVSAIGYLNKYHNILNSQLRPDVLAAAGKSRKESELSRSPYWLDDNGEVRRANLVKYQIKNRIREKGLNKGDKLGLESEWVDALGVSRSVFREAIRMLEQTGIVRTKSGRNGGWVVSDANPERTVLAVVTFLKYYAVADFDQMNDTRDSLDSLAVDQAIQNLDDESEGNLKNAMELELQREGYDFFNTAVDVYRMIRELGQNRIIKIYTEVIIQLQLSNIDRNFLEKRVFSLESRIKNSHNSLVEAIINKDKPFAQRRLIEHKRNITELLRN